MQSGTRDQPSSPDFLAGGGEMGALIRGHDWASTALGPPEGWPQSLRTVIRLILNTQHPMSIVWGAEGLRIYNDACRPLIGPEGHPGSLGRPMREFLAATWHLVGPQLEQVMGGGRAIWQENALVPIVRDGVLADAYWTYSFSPIDDERAPGGVGGVLVIFNETTKTVAAFRRMAQTEERLELALSVGNGIGTWDWDVPGDRVFADARFARLYGVHPERAAVGAPIADFFANIHPDDLPAVQIRIEEVLRSGEMMRVEYRLVSPDGTVRWLASEGQCSLDAHGQPVRFPGVTFDITARRLAQDALTESETRYRALFNAMEEGFAIFEFFDGPHGPLSDFIHLEANPAYAENTGLGDVVGRTVRELIGDEAQGWIDLYGEVLRTGRPMRFERELEARGRWLELAAFRVEPASRNQVAVIFKDLTARKQAELALRESEAQFRAFAQAVPNHVWASRPDGHLYWFNQQVYAYTGLEEGALDGAAGWGEVVHPEDLPVAGEVWAGSLASGNIYETEFRLRRADGQWRWFVVRAEPVRDESGAVIRWVGANIDIDDIRRQGAELERVNDILSGLLRGTTAERDRLWTLSEDMLARADYSGGLLAVNPVWTRTLGWSERELLTNPYADIIHPDDLEATTTRLAQMAETGQPTRLENRIRSSSGQWISIGWTLSPETDGVHFIAVGRDLTEDKAREHMLAQAQAALRQSQKMEAVGQLTGGIAHDFNNLLAGISGSLELLSKRLSEGRLNGMERYIDAAQGSAQRAAALTQRLLAFSRRQTLDPKPTDLNRLIAGMEDLIQRSVGPDVEVEVVAAAGLWTTRIDPSQLENALLNLCINGRDAMAPGGGRLTIETANTQLDAGPAAADDLPPGQYVSLFVTDTGTGMPPEVQAQAFDPFFTTKPLGQGTGLGLSMIHGFVRQSGGQVRIHSEMGKGSTLYLHLPRYQGDADESEAVAAAAAPESGHGETVLIIEDEETVRMLVVEVLEEAGYVVLQALDGPSGLAILQSEARIDLLVSDVGLPGGMNGRQVADAARVVRPDLKVLFVTGYAENAAVGNGQLDPGMAVITKPFQISHLGARVREMIEAA